MMPSTESKHALGDALAEDSAAKFPAGMLKLGVISVELNLLAEALHRLHEEITSLVDSMGPQGLADAERDAFWDAFLAEVDRARADN
jgi:hypothetical protein